MSNPFQQTMVRMQLPAGASRSVSVRGFTVEAEADGCVTVPKDVAAELASHGMTVAPSVPVAKSPVAK